MKRILFALTLLGLLFSCNREKTDPSGGSSGGKTSLVETLEASEIEADRATLNAKLDLTGISYQNVSFGFLWGTSESALEEDIPCTDIHDKAFSASLEGLSPNTQYWYKAYVKLDSQTYYGDVKSFTTGVIPVESVSLDKTEYTFHTIGSTLTLEATVLPADATDKSVNWSSSNPSVASVSGSGVVTGVSNGTATITATAGDGSGVSASCEVEVQQYVTSITLDKTSLSLIVGAEATLSVTSVLPDNAQDKTYSWSSSNSATASVDNSGKVTAKVKGTATINATANDGSGVFASCSVTVKNPCPSGAVDLGLSVYWATRNLCTSGFVGSPQDYGDYYAWGEVEPYYSSQDPLTWKTGKTAGYGWASYKYCNGSESTLTKYNYDSSRGTVDNKTVLEPEDDVASKKLGGNWRMPTTADWTELRTNCTTAWTSNYNGTGVRGLIVTAANGNSIFLPAAGGRNGKILSAAGSSGYYWSSSIHTETPFLALYGLFDSDDVLEDGSTHRCYGLSVRPVAD